MDKTGVIVTRSKLSKESVQRKKTLYNKGKQCPLEEDSERKRVKKKETPRIPTQTRGVIKTELMSKRSTKEKNVKSEGRTEKFMVHRQKLSAAKAAAKQSKKNNDNGNNTKKRQQRGRNADKEIFKVQHNKNQRRTSGALKFHPDKSNVGVQRVRLSTTKKSVKKVTINRKQQGKTPNTKTKEKKETKHRRVSVGVKTTEDGKTRQKKVQNKVQSNEKDRNKHEGRNTGHFYFEEVNSFNGDKPGVLNNPHSICPVSDDKAWVAFNFSDTIYLFNKSGVVEQMLKMPGNADDIALRPDGSLLVTNFKSGTVWSVDKSFHKIKTEKSFEMAPLISRGISCLGNEVVICYVNRMSLKRSHDDDKRIVMKWTSKGKKIQEYIQLADNEKFECPYRVALNANGDVLLVDHGRSQLIIMDADGKEKCRYPKEQLSSFDIYGVTCNSDGFIFVSDHIRHCVDVLYPDGRYCQTLIGNTGPLNNIKMDNVGDLWIGSLTPPHIRIIRVSKRTF